MSALVDVPIAFVDPLSRRLVLDSFVDIIPPLIPPFPPFDAIPFDRAFVVVLPQLHEHVDPAPNVVEQHTELLAISERS